MPKEAVKTKDKPTATDDIKVAVSEQNKIREGIAESMEGFDTDNVVQIASLGSGYTYTEEKRPLTNELALRMLSLGDLPYDRKLKNYVVEALIEKMCNGSFLPEIVILADAELNGVFHRINGHHVSWARSWFHDKDPERSKKFHPLVKFIHYKVKDEETLRLIYSNTDRGVIRGSDDVALSVLKATPEFPDESSKTLKSLFRGVKQWIWAGKSGTAGNRCTSDKAGYLLKTDHYRVAKKIAGFIPTCATKEASHMDRASVYGAMFATFSKSAEDSIEFWSKVRDGTLLQANDPRLKLRNILLQHSVQSGGAGNCARRNTVSTEEMYFWCLAAWNAYRDGRENGKVKFHYKPESPRITAK